MADVLHVSLTCEAPHALDARMAFTPYTLEYDYSTEYSTACWCSLTAATLLGLQLSHCSSMSTSHLLRYPLKGMVNLLFPLVQRAPPANSHPKTPLFSSPPPSPPTRTGRRPHDALLESHLVVETRPSLRPLLTTDPRPPRLRRISARSPASGPRPKFILAALTAQRAGAHPPPGREGATTTTTTTVSWHCPGVLR